MIQIKPSMQVTDFPSKRSFTQAMVEVHQAQGVLWHGKMLRPHFKPGAEKTYGYATRSTKYKQWKRKTWESRRPLPNGEYVEGSGVIDNVLSGDMRDMMLKSSSVRPLPGRVTVTIDAPRYVTMKVFDGDAARAIREGWTYGRKKKKFNASRIGTQPDKQKEIQTTTVQEREELARCADGILQRRLSERLNRKRNDKGQYT